MSTSNRRRSSSIKILPPKGRASRPLSLDEEIRHNREMIYKLENSVVQAETYLSDEDTWRRKPSRRMPASAQAKNKRAFTQVAIEAFFGSILVIGLLCFLKQRFGS
jgi:hypothetical protein